VWIALSGRQPAHPQHRRGRASHPRQSSVSAETKARRSSQRLPQVRVDRVQLHRPRRRNRRNHHRRRQQPHLRHARRHLHLRLEDRQQAIGEHLPPTRHPTERRHLPASQLQVHKIERPGTEPRRRKATALDCGNPAVELHRILPAAIFERQPSRLPASIDTCCHTTARSLCIPAYPAITQVIRFSFFSERMFR
jgi:hypothetical protein